MTVLVVGATSQVGHFLLALLADEGIQPLALTRQESWPSSVVPVRWLRGDLGKSMPVVPPLSWIFSAGPLDALAAWLPDAPMLPGARVLATSSMSAASKLDSPVAGERALAMRLNNAEAAVRSACIERGAGWTIIRPTIIYGAGRDRSFTPLACRARRTRLFPLPAGTGLRQPVHAGDVAHALLSAARRPVCVDAILELGGGERLPSAEVFARVRSSLPFATLGIPIPNLVLRTLAIHPALRGPITRLGADLVADNQAAIEALGVRPRTFAPDAKCWGM